MAIHNPKNERVKHRYFAYLKEADRYGEARSSRTARETRSTRTRGAGRWDPCGRQSVMLIVHGRLKTCGSSIVAS